MRNLLPVAAAVGLSFGNPVSASGFDFSFSDETANLEFTAPVTSIIENGGQVSLGVLYNDLNDVVLHGKVVAVGTQTNTRLPYQLTVGAKAYTGKVKEAEVDIGAIAVGGAINIQFSSGYNPMDWTVEGFFTPGITTFGNTESLLEIGSRLSIEVVPQAKAFIGYRLLEVEDERNLTWEIDDNIHVGIRLQF